MLIPSYIEDKVSRIYMRSCLSSLPTLCQHDRSSNTSRMPDFHHEDSLGLQQVEPSPVEETPIEAKDGYFGSNDTGSSSPQRSTSSLGLSQHNAIWYLNRIQKYSSWVFTAFGVAHVRRAIVQYSSDTLT